MLKQDTARLQIPREDFGSKGFRSSAHTWTSMGNPVIGQARFLIEGETRG